MRVSVHRSMVVVRLDGYAPEALLAMIRSRNDDGQPPLRVERSGFTRAGGSVFRVQRTDFTLPSETERRHVRAVLAAHAAQPFRAA